MTEIQPTEQPAYWLVEGAETYTGMTNLGELTGVGAGYAATFGEGEMDALEAMAMQAAAFPALPDSGWLEQGDIYQWDDTLVMVRQSHNRTLYDPDETPALFCVYRENAGDVLEWVAGEQVYIGTHRLYEDVEYRCIQAHVTQSDWTPPAVPTLWALVVPPTPEWAAGVAYTGDNTAGAGNGDVVTYQGASYRCLQSHTSIITWTPPAVPALWLAL